MAQLLLWIEERVLSGDDVTDLMRYAPGMVVDIYPDEQLMSKEMLAEPRWKLVQIPKVSVEELRYLTVGDKPKIKGPILPLRESLRRRTVELPVADLDALLADPVKGQEVKTNPAAAKAHLQALAKAVPEPAKLGAVVKGG